ncbi:MAG TPA: hypothetical protein DGR97_12315 [Gammaproteobacteria bacterium]|nr:hypothetical protein [Gammaproteobacteria bacterium]|tara:strand:+ start:7 stop:588 length:582 start_codon:yes stop_codon:yes gene_type:complete
MSKSDSGPIKSDHWSDIGHSFVGWQCRLRQHVVRRGDGRPSAGMCPHVELPGGQRLGTIVTVLVKADPSHVISQFKQIVKRMAEPLERYEAAIGMLQTVYYQYPREFSDSLTALFNSEAPTARAILGVGRCILDYRQANQRYTIPCVVQSLPIEDAYYQATYWHNLMFNSKLSAPVSVLKFVPEWSVALADTS